LASIVVAPLMLFGAMHTAQSISSGARIQLAAGGDSTFHGYTYIQKARGAMHEWQKKLHDFSEKAKAKGQEEGIAAENELNAAWDQSRRRATQVAERERGRLGERQDLVREGIPEGGLGQNLTQ
jgi:hypothetical protein